MIEGRAAQPRESMKVPSIVADFRVVGLNYRTAALRTRTAVSFDQVGVLELLRSLKERGVTESMVLCTCNRTEVYFFGAGFEEALSALSQLSEVPFEKLESASYRHEELKAVSQLFRVASGLDSAVLGEHEVLGQVKAAHRLAKEAGTIGKRLDPVYQRALRASKRVRNESDLGREVTSVGTMALRRASELVGGLSGKKILLIGAGQIAERVAKDLFHAGHTSAFVCNRTHTRAARLASVYNLQTWDYSELDGGLAMADIVICAVAATAPVIAAGRLERARGSRSVVVIDLGMPPNFHSDFESASTRLVNMESIVKACQANSRSRAAAVPKAGAIIDEEVEAYVREGFEREAAPYIQAISELAEEVRVRNLDWAISQNPSASAKERKLLEDLSIRIVRGMLQGPIHALKNELREPVERTVLARLFAVEAPPTVVAD